MSWKAGFTKLFTEITSLEEGAQKVYLTLFMDNYPKSFRVSEIANMTGLHRSYTYDVIKSLLQFHLLVEHTGSPKTYSARTPEVYIETLKTRYQLKILKISQFKQLVDTQVMNTLLPHVSVTQTKQSFFINSRQAFEEYIKKVLPETRRRIYLSIENDIWKDMLPIFENSLSKLINHDDVRVIVFDRNEPIMGYPGWYVSTKTQLSSMQILLDDHVFIFTPYHGTNLLSGMGVVMIDPVIADSYRFSIDYQFRTHYYNQNPLDPEPFIHDIIKQQPGIYHALRLLFDKGWKVLDLETKPEKQYIGLLAPHASTDTLFRECGLRFVPYYGNDKEDVIDEVYEDAKLTCINIMKEVTRYGGASFTINEGTEIINGFKCTKFVAETTIPVEHINENKIPLPKNVDLVFNYNDVGVILVFGLDEENTHEIIEMLAQTKS